MNPTETQPAQPTPKLFSQCTTYGKFGIASRLPTILIWWPDDKIGAYLFDPPTNTYTGIIVETYVKDISLVGYVNSMLNFTVGKTAYSFDFSADATLVFLGGTTVGSTISATSETVGGQLAGVGTSLAGIAVSQQMANQSDIGAWINQFQVAGIKIKNIFGRKPVIIMCIVLLGSVIGGALVLQAITQ